MGMDLSNTIKGFMHEEEQINAGIVSGSDHVTLEGHREPGLSRVLTFPEKGMSGSELVARSLNLILDENAVVMGVPGSPTTGVVDWLEANSHLRDGKIWVEINEVDMMRKLLGANACGLQTVAIMKHTGFFRIQEQLVAMSNHDLVAPMVLVVGDEPGKSSQNGNDSRALCDATYIPIIEPSFHNIPEAVARCLSLSSLLRKPVVLRVVPSLVDYTCVPANSVWEVVLPVLRYQGTGRDYYATEGMVLGRYHRTKTMLRRMELSDYTGSALNQAQHSNSDKLVIAAGGIADHTRDILARSCHEVGFMEINTVSQLPEQQLAGILRNYNSLLVLENWEPYLERRLRAFAQRTGAVGVRIYGREPAPAADGSVEASVSEGGLEREGIRPVMERFFSGADATDRSCHASVCEYSFSSDIDRRYITLFEEFCVLALARGTRPVFSLSTGRTRYSVMGTEYEKYVKFMAPMGSEAMTLLGYLEHSGEDLAPCVVIGDYTFCHSAWHGLSSIESYRRMTGRKVPTLIIDNGGSWTTGGHACTAPSMVGPSHVVGWDRRLYGRVNIHDRDALRGAIVGLLDETSVHDIAIIGVED